MMGRLGWRPCHPRIIPGQLTCCLQHGARPRAGYSQFQLLQAAKPLNDFLFVQAKSEVVPDNRDGLSSLDAS
jgi:hypothetical protein